jgi:hypothetical protein
MAAVIDVYTSRATMFATAPTVGTTALLRSNDITGGRTASVWVYTGAELGWVMSSHPVAF